MSAELSDQEMLRYNRQIILRGFDFAGQERLKSSRVLITGLGDLAVLLRNIWHRQGSGNSPCWILIPCRSLIYSARYYTMIAPSVRLKFTPPLMH